MADQKSPEMVPNAWEQVGDPAATVVRKAAQRIASRHDQDNASAAGNDKRQAAEK